jgi:hypothetical protein
MSPARDLAIYDSQLYENVVFYILPHRGAEILQRNSRVKREPYNSPAFFRPRLNRFANQFKMEMALEMPANRAS